MKNTIRKTLALLMSLVIVFTLTVATSAASTYRYAESTTSEESETSLFTAWVEGNKFIETPRYYRMGNAGAYLVTYNPNENGEEINPWYDFLETDITFRAIGSSTITDSEYIELFFDDYYYMYGSLGRAFTANQAVTRIETRTIAYIYNANMLMADLSLYVES